MLVGCYGVGVVVVPAPQMHMGWFCGDGVRSGVDTVGMVTPGGCDDLGVAVMPAPTKAGAGFGWVSHATGTL
ncbi:hypothetical protein GCM10027400_14000 [Pseudoxanthomonas daejeonensis]